jgi:hypothetical protein
MAASGAGELAFWLAVGLIGLGVTTGPIGKAIGQAVEALVGRLAGRAGADHSAELEELSHQVGDLRGMEHRVLELEERLDFAERLLTSGRQANAPEADTPPEPVDAAR